MRIPKFYTLYFVLCTLYFFLPKTLLSQEVNPNGYNKFTYPNGSILSEGNMKEGKPDGYWKNYFLNGTIKSEGNRKASMLDSLWIFYNERGDTLKKITYIFGKKGGFYYTFQASTDSLKNTILTKELYVNDKRQGKAYYYYSNGNIHKQLSFKDNMKHGKGVEYKKDGLTLKTTYKYRYDFLLNSQTINRFASTGEKNGKWVEFHDNGKIKRQVNYNKGKINGLLKEYDTKGKQVIAQKFQNGTKVAKDTSTTTAKIHTEVYADGSVKSSGAFKDGKPVGIHRTFKEDGSSSQANVYTDLGVLMASGLLNEKGKKQAKWKFYYPTGGLKSEGNYKSNRKTGEWSYYFVEGELEQQGNYKGGRLSGSWKWYYETGELLREENYLKGLSEGELIEYTKAEEIVTQGKLLEGKKTGKWFYNVGDHTEEGSYREGKRTGKWKYYYPNGRLKYECNYSLGKESGKAIIYFKNRKIEEERYYSMGIADRVWRKYNDDGVLILRLDYEYGILIKVDGKKLALKEDEMNN